MFDLGLTELLVIGIVALIIVGPKDLPVLFRRVGEFVGRMKGMAREFTSAMNEAADQAGAPNSSYFSNTCAKCSRSSSEFVVFREHVCKVLPFEFRIRSIH